MAKFYKFTSTYMAKLKAHIYGVVRQFIMSSIKVIACKRLLGSKTLSHCKMLKMSLSTLLNWNQGET